MRNRYHPLFLVFLLLVISCKEKQRQAPPLVDGNLDDFIRLEVKPIKASDEVNIYMYQDEHYVWLAYDYPEGSYGTLDLKLIAPNLNDTLNLHVSGQSGEWYTSEGSPRPDNPESELWWNHDSWYANEVWINGMNREGDEARYNFKNGKARELQIAKDRFGRGQWHMKFNIRAIQTTDGFTSINFPEKYMYTLNAY